jgi:hypothetical protein
MSSSSRLSAGLVAIAVAAVCVVMSVIGAAGGSTSIAGSARRAVPGQEVPSQNLAAFKQNPAQTNNLYVPITPCRVVDTRLAGGKFVSGTTRTYLIAGTTGFAAQGGNASGCGIPPAATAVAANLTANGPSVGGYLRAWPSTISTEPNATVLTYLAGPGNISGATLSIAPGVAQSLTVRNHSGTTDLVIDVTGYYEPQMHGMVSPSSTSDSTHNAPIFAGSSRIVSATNPSTGVYVVTFDSTITYCTPIVDTYNAGSGIYGAAYAFSGNTATVFTWYLSATTHVETLYSYYFYITVVC